MNRPLTQESYSRRGWCGRWLSLMWWYRIGMSHIQGNSWKRSGWVEEKVEKRSSKCSLKKYIQADSGSTSQVQRIQNGIIVLVPLWHLSEENYGYHHRHLRMTRTNNRMRIFKIPSKILYLVYTNIITILILLRFSLIMKKCDQ